MEKLQSSRPWRKKPNESSMMARNDYKDVFGVPPWHTSPFSVRLDDYSEIFDATASVSSIPVLDLSMVEDGFETVGDSAGAGGCRDDVDYFHIFGSFGGGGFAPSYEDFFAEPKRWGVSSSEGRTRGNVFSKQQEKEVSEHPLKVYTEFNEPNLEKNQFSSFPRQSDDISSKQFSMSSHIMSRETIDYVVSDKTCRGKLDAISGYPVTFDARDSVQQSENKAVDKGTVVNTGTKGYTPDGGQKNDAAPYFLYSEKNFAVNPPQSNCVSLLDVPGDEKHNSRSDSRHSTSSGYKPLHDVTYLKVSEISLQTKPFKGPPPSRPPPELSMKPEHPKVLCADSRFDVEESSLKSKVNKELHSSSEATKIHTIDESKKCISFSHDSEMDPSSAAAVSIAAIKEAMEQAQVRLTSAKKLMDRKRDKSHWKVGPLKAMSKEDGTAYEVEMKSRSKVKDANNLLKESNTISECTAVEREEIRNAMNHEETKMQLPSCRKDQQQVSKENAAISFVEREEIKTARKIALKHEERKMQLPSYKKCQQQVRKENAPKSSEVACNIVEIAEECKTDEEYYELLRNDRLLNTVKGIYIKGDEKKAKADICSCEKEKYCKDSEQAIEVEEKQKLMEVSVCVEKLEKDHKLKGPRMDCMEEANKNLADATMVEFLLKNHVSKLEEDYGSFLSDENQKHSEAHEDNNNENNANEPDSVVDYCLYKENVKKFQNSNIDFKPGVANGYCQEKELKATEGVSGYVEYKRKFIVSHVKYEVSESNKEVKVQNETLFHDIFEKEIKEPVELFTFNTTDKYEEIKPCNNYDDETRSMKHQYAYNAYICKVEESDNAAEKDEVDEFQAVEEAHILEHELEQEAIHDENGLENGLEMSEAQEKIKDAELEQILNSREGAYCKDYSEKETREDRTALQEDEESMEALMNQEAKNSELLASSDGVWGKRVSENFTVPVLVENQISSNSADDACQLGEIEESDSRKDLLSRKEGSMLTTVQDATDLVDKAENHKHSLYTEVEENKRKMNVDRERDKEPETSFEENDLDTERERERERIAVERANYEAHQQVLAEARVRTERIAVERATAEARQRALEESRQKAEKVAEAEKASREAMLRAERAAVERATEEARKRAIEKALAGKAAADARERKAQVSASNRDRLRKDNRTEDFKATHIKEDSDAKHKPTLAKIQRNAQSQTAASSANEHIYSDSQNILGGAESKLRCKARQEMQQKTAERAANALAERNMRDILAQREQAERDRLAESLYGEVRRWSSGKDGNLRALLSTLQYILGPDSGWQPIPLTDIMNASAAKKAYRKATLCVHPDKLQQRGAAIQQKYICEKVFDLLQDAWNKFNSEEQ